MTRVPLAELIYQGANPVRTAPGRQVFVYTRGTKEQASIYAAETGESTVTQPLVTDAGGLPTSNGSQVWIVAGAYTFEVAGSLVPVQVNSSLQTTSEVLNVSEFGAKSGLVSDATPAFERAIAALPAEGGEIFAPGQYKLSGPLNFDEKRSVRLTGQSSLTGGNSPRSQLLFTQGSASALISARSQAGFGMADLGVFYSSGSQTGPLLDLSHGVAGTDSAFGSFERCNFVGQSVRSAVGVNLDKAINMGFRDCVFNNLDVGVIGQASAARYSNVVGFDRCGFAGMGTIPAKNAGEAWAFRSCTFEQLNSGAAGAYTSDPGVTAAGLTFDGCWFGDGNTTGTWILFRGEGLNVRGGSLGSGALGISVPDSSSDGLVVQGVRFISIAKGIEANFGAVTRRYIIGGNTFNTVSGKKVSLDNGTTDMGAGFLAS